MESKQTKSAIQERPSQASMLSRFVTIILFGIVFSFGIHVADYFEPQQEISAKTILKTSKIKVAHVPFTAPFNSEPLLPPSNFPDENKIEEEGADENTLEFDSFLKRQTLLAHDCQSLRLRPLRIFEKRNSRALFVLHHSWKIFPA